MLLLQIGTWYIPAHSITGITVRNKLHSDEHVIWVDISYTHNGSDYTTNIGFKYLVKMEEFMEALSKVSGILHITETGIIQG